MKPSIIIVGIGKYTHVYLDGREIGNGVSDLIYSARNEHGEICPTLKLLEVDLRKFTWDGTTIKEELANLGVSVEKITPAQPEGQSDEAGRAKN